MRIRNIGCNVRDKWWCEGAKEANGARKSQVKNERSFPTRVKEDIKVFIIFPSFFPSFIYSFPCPFKNFVYFSSLFSLFLLFSFLSLEKKYGACSCIGALPNSRGLAARVAKPILWLPRCLDRLLNNQHTKHLGYIMQSGFYHLCIERERFNKYWG